MQGAVVPPDCWSGRVFNVGDSLARVFLPRKWRSDHDALTDESAERGRALLRQEQVRACVRTCVGVRVCVCAVVWDGSFSAG